MFVSRIYSNLRSWLPIAVILILLATLLSCGGDPILNPRNVDEDEADSQDDAEQDPDQGGGQGDLSSNRVLGPIQGQVIFLS